MLGRLYGPRDGKTIEGVTGKDLTNPIPEWSEYGVPRPFHQGTPRVRGG